MKEILLLIFIFLFTLNFISSFLLNEQMGNEPTENILITNNTINFNSLTLKQKLAQMIIVRGDEFDEGFVEFNVGGIFLDRQESLEDYKKLIEMYQDSSKIKLFVATDFEGAWNPFVNAEISEEDFPKFSEIKNSEEAHEVGFNQGILLKDVGFNLNFAPVAEFEDVAYGGRVFSGTKEEIEEKLKNYIRGLQENVLGTCKHYPGKGMIKNTHVWFDKQEISEEDLELFEVCFEENISAVMVGHQKVFGFLDSKNKQASVSEEVIEKLDKEVLVIGDEVNMFGLKLSYLFSKRKMYRDLINSGENLILDFKLDSEKLNSLLEDLKKDVVKGKIDEERVNNSVMKILRKKGYEINFS